MDLRERGSDRDGFGPKRHPWEVVRSRFFLSVLADHGALDAPGAWLDVGAGDAWVGGKLLSRLPPDSTVLGWDINYDGKDLSSLDLPAGMCLTASRPSERFDGVVLLDVIEHVADDRAFVDDVIGELTAPGGWVLVSVPAWPRLFSDHDRFLRHYRRYLPSQCRRLLSDGGVDVVASGGVFHSLLGVRALQVSRQRLTHRSVDGGGVGTWDKGPAATALVTSALTAEVWLSRWAAGRNLQFPGLSFWVLGRRAR